MTNANIIEGGRARLYADVYFALPVWPGDDIVKSRTVTVHPSYRRLSQRGRLHYVVRGHGGWYSYEAVLVVKAVAA